MRLERPRHAARLTRHLLAQLVCLGSHTVTGLVGVCGEQHRDWSAHYRLYSKERADPERLFDVVRATLCARDEEPLVVALDDTRVRKTGPKIHGVKYTRDPMGPAFHVNFVRAQRFLQTSMAMRGEGGQARMVPVDWRHAPTPQRPGKKAGQDEQDAYKQACKQAAIAVVGAERIAHLRRWLDHNGAHGRHLRGVVDGSFINGSLLRNLPKNTTVVGRIRSDAKLHYLPDSQKAKGRRRAYGDPAPTPEALRIDESHPWQDVEVCYGGQLRTLRAKHLGPVRWRPAGQHLDLQLIVIAPIPYRQSPRGRRHYRQPSYLICTDPDAPLQDVIQHYIWRWDIEVNFRDEKTLLGLGDAQVRTKEAVENLTATTVAAYALLHLAADRCRRQGADIDHLPAPKWQSDKPRRATTMNLIQNLRHELWARSIYFSGFACANTKNTKSQKSLLPLETALFSASTYT